jgi:hypothetical protein
MMGLPGDTEQRFSRSITETIALQPDLVRIYPTLVLAGTKLSEWHAGGDYRPLTLEEAIVWGTAAYDSLLRLNPHCPDGIARRSRTGETWRNCRPIIRHSANWFAAAGGDRISCALRR